MNSIKNNVMDNETKKRKEEERITVPLTKEDRAVIAGVKETFEQKTNPKENQKNNPKKSKKEC